MNKIKIILSDSELALATEYQENYKKLFNKNLSLEDLFKISLFFSNNINNIKLNILDSYNTNTAPVTPEATTKTRNKTNTEQRDIWEWVK